MRPRIGRLWVIALALGGPLGAARGAEPAVTIEDYRVGFGGTYKAGAWTPIWVNLTGGPDRFTGRLEAVVGDDDGTPTTTLATRPVEIGPRETVTTQVYIRASRNAEIVLRVRDDNGRRRTPDVEVNNSPNRAPTELEPGQIVVATLGTPRGVDEVPSLSGFAQGTAVASGQPSEVVVPRIDPRDAPTRWYGYDAAQAIVLDTNDRQVLDLLRDRGQGLQEWVLRGGHLVVAVASNWQEVREGILADMLPALPSGTTRLNDRSSLEAFAGADKPIPAAMNIAVLEGFEARGGKVLAETAATPATPLVVRGPFGFGRITVVGLDVDQKPFGDWEDKKRFWSKVLDLHPRGTEPNPNAPPVPGAFYQNTTTDLSSLLNRSLENVFPGVTLVPFGWVALFVFLYILLIGPGDYFFLKKVVKRMELTWITFPTIVLVVSLVAYVAAYAVKGTELRINKVDAVDLDQTRGLARGTTWATLFSPQNRDYDLAIAPGPLDQAAAPGSVTPRTAGTESLMTWFGAPDPRFGGAGGGQFGLSGSGYTYGPPGEIERLEGVRIPIWSTKSVTARWLAPVASPMIQADLTPVGSDRIDGTLKNASGRTLKDAVLIVGKQIYDQLGTLAPGASVQITPASRSRPLSGYLEEISQNFGTNSNAYVAYGDDTEAKNLSRPNLIKTMMFRDAMAARTEAVANIPFHDLDLSGLLPLDRPMLVAEIDGPAASLVLEGAPSEPKTQQTTILRILLAPPGANPASTGADEPAD